jgi:Na+/H+ antiporter NhaD/arsenite permease-like protein
MADDRQSDPHDFDSRFETPGTAESRPQSMGGFGAERKPPAVRILRWLLRGLVGVIAGTILWLFTAIRFLGRIFSKRAASAQSHPPRPGPAVQPFGVRRRLARSFLRHAPWRMIALAAGLMILVGAGFITGCMLTCFGVSRYFLWNE